MGRKLRRGFRSGAKGILMRGDCCLLYAMITNDAKTGVLFGRINIRRLCDYGLIR